MNGDNCGEKKKVKKKSNYFLGLGGGAGGLGFALIGGGGFLNLGGPVVSVGDGSESGVATAAEVLRRGTEGVDTAGNAGGLAGCVAGVAGRLLLASSLVAVTTDGNGNAGLFFEPTKSR